MKNRFYILLLVIVFVIFGWFLRGMYYQNDRIEIKEIEFIKIIDSDYYFIFENFNNPELVSLVKREGIIKLLSKTDKEFQKILLVKQWVKEQLGVPGFPNPYPPWNAEIILRWVRDGKISVFCGQYTIVFAQILTGLGIPARYVDINAKNGNSHFLTEVWSRDFDKWVVMDPYLDIYYEAQGIPLNALEISRAYRNNILKDIKVVAGGNKVKKATIDDIQLFYNFRIVLRNNHWNHSVHIHNKVTTVNNNLNLSLFWDDLFLQYKGIQSEPLFYWKPDLCNVNIIDKDQKRGKLTLEFNTLLTSNDKYLLIYNGKRDIVKSPYVWELQPGYNKLEVIPMRKGFDVQSNVVAILK